LMLECGSIKDSIYWNINYQYYKTLFRNNIFVKTKFI
jgi:hypothetical protein